MSDAPKPHRNEMIDGFRWRSHEITRIEGFSDACFGFAVTLLIVSLEVPHTSTELLHMMRGFGAFVMTFMMLAGIWYAQHAFFRRYGLEDNFTVSMNLVLLFTVLFFVYPLKFLFSLLFTDPNMKSKVMTEHGLVPAVLPEHKLLIFAIFAAGLAAVFTIFVLLYRHAYKKREELGLNEFEVYETVHSIRRQLLMIGISLIYLILGAATAMPKTTKPQKMMVLATVLVSLVLDIGLIAALIVLNLRRKKYKKAWLAQQEAHAQPLP
jgi:uncharacterized membrane protein